MNVEIILTLLTSLSEGYMTNPKKIWKMNRSVRRVEAECGGASLLEGRRGEGREKEEGMGSIKDLLSR